MSIRGRGAIVLALVGLAAGCGMSDPTEEPASATTPSAESESEAPGEPPTESVDRDGQQTVLFFGDSYVVGGGYTDADDSMAALAANRLGWEYHIAGAGGTGFVTDNPGFDLPAYPEQVEAGALDVGPVDWVVIEGGGNDDGADPGQVTAAAVGVVEAAAEQHPEARLVLVASMDPTVEDFGDTDGVTAALADAAEQTDVAFVDAQRWLEGRPELIGPVLKVK